MTSAKLTAALAVFVVMGFAAPTSAGQRHGGGASAGHGRAVSRPGGAVGRAVPRGATTVRPGAIGPYRSSGHRPYPYYYPSFGLGLYPGYLGHYGYPFSYSLYGYGGFGHYAYGSRYGYGPYGSSPYGYGPYGYGAYGSGYGYGNGYGYSGGYAGGALRAYGRVRLRVKPRGAQVFLDGNYVGTVDDFDGAFQHLAVEAGPHQIEIRAPGFETVAFDVDVRPGPTITYRGGMRPLQP